MLFEQRLQRGLRDGSIRVAFRRWKRAQAVAGHRYRSPIGMIQGDCVDRVEDPRSINLDDARAAGYASVDALLDDLNGPSESTLFRLELRLSPEADPRSLLAESDALDDGQRRALNARLARLDASHTAPWTGETLKAIDAQPGLRAGDLMLPLGWTDLAEFKLHVRKLKALGLTLSLRVGYELSPRGRAYLRTQ